MKVINFYYKDIERIFAKFNEERSFQSLTLGDEDSERMLSDDENEMEVSQETDSNETDSTDENEMEVDEITEIIEYSFNC